MVHAFNFKLAFCTSLGTVPYVQTAKLRLCNSRFSLSSPLLAVGTWHSRVAVACMSPPLNISDSSRIPETSMESKVEDPDDMYLPPNTELVSLPLPLGVYTEQTADGKVFVDEIEQDGNAKKLRGLQVGDVIVAVSLPFGNGLLPVPKAGGLDMIADHISSRDPNEPFFHIAISKDHDINDLRNNIEVDEGWLTADEALKLAQKIHVLEYPKVPSHEDDEKDDFETQEKDLEEYGFDKECIKSILENKNQA